MTAVGQKTLLMVRKNLLYFRKRILKKSLDEMSSDIKISRDTLYRLENNGDTEKPLYPNLKTLIVITDYLKLDLADFISKDLEMEEMSRLERIEKIERLGDNISNSFYCGELLSVVPSD